MSTLKGFSAKVRHRLETDASIRGEAREAGFVPSNRRYPKGYLRLLADGGSLRFITYACGIVLVLFLLGACAPAATKTPLPIAVTVYHAGSPTPGGKPIVP